MVRIAVEDAGLEEDARVVPDVVQNRFGTIYGKYTLLELEDGGRSLFIPLYVAGKKARLGLFLSDASPAGLEDLCAFVFTRFNVKRIDWECSLSPLGSRYVCRNHSTNHWKVTLPASTDVLWSRMSRKSRYNRRREEKNLLERLGGENTMACGDLVMSEYEGAEKIAPSIVETFFSFKKQLMNRDYGLTPSEYLAHYHVTNAYTWTYGTRIVAIVFSCEQGKNVFLENLTYDPEFEEYSPGFHLYGRVIERLIQKGKTALFLGGGKQPYKARFDGQEDSCYNVEVYRNVLAALPSYALKFLKRLGGAFTSCFAEKENSRGEAAVPKAGRKRRRGFFQKAFHFAFVRIKYASQYLFYTFVPLGQTLNTEKRAFSITVSLTSFPPRLPTLHLCIKSLMRQTMKADRIVLYLGKDCKGIPLPKKLLALQKYGLTIRTACDDLRPHKKYIYAMKEYPDDFVITVDDDLLYASDLIEGLWAAHLKEPAALIASRVHLMRQKGGRILPYRDWLQETDRVREATHALLSTNGAGSLFPPHCLPAEALDEGLARELCLNADDIWLKFMLLRGGTKVLWAGKRAGMPDEIRIKADKKQALMDDNLKKDGNDGYIAALESHFNMNLADYCREGKD